MSAGDAERTWLDRQLDDPEVRRAYDEERARLTGDPELAAPIIWFPTREDIDAIEVGGMAPNAFGEMAEVVNVSARRDDVDGARFVCYSTRTSPTSSMTMLLKQDTVARTVALCAVLSSAEIDALETKLRAARYVDGIEHPERLVVWIDAAVRL